MNLHSFRCVVVLHTFHYGICSQKQLLLFSIHPTRVHKLYVLRTIIFSALELNPTYSNGLSMVIWGLLFRVLQSLCSHWLSAKVPIDYWLLVDILIMLTLVQISITKHFHYHAKRDIFIVCRCWFLSCTLSWPSKCFILIFYSLMVKVLGRPYFPGGSETPP